MGGRPDKKKLAANRGQNPLKKRRKGDVGESRFDEVRRVEEGEGGGEK